MKARKYWILILILVACTLLLSINVSGLSYWEKDQIKTFGISTLYGIKTIWTSVLIKHLYNEIPTDKATLTPKVKSLTISSLETQLELALRKSGIKVISETEGGLSPHTGELNVYIEVHSLKIFQNTNFETVIYAYKVSVEFYQLVKLDRNPEIYTFARTWPQHSYKPASVVELNIVGRDKIEEAIKRKMTERINEFLNDYLAANPKETEAKSKNNK